jgi:hypothetical protein
MALTQGAWTEQTTSNSNAVVYKCTVTFTTAENDAYTLKTPVDAIDPTKQGSVWIVCAATPDGVALPVDVWGGWANFALSGDGASVEAADGVKIKQVLDDCVLAVDPLIYQIDFDPDLPVADVTTVAAIASGLKVRIPKFPHYAFNLNGASTLNATSADFYTVQYI